MRVPKSTGGWRPIPEGDQRLTVIEAKEIKSVGHVEVKFENEDGLKHTETYRIGGTKKHPINEVALNLFAWLCDVCLGDDRDEDIDVSDLVDCEFDCVIEHHESKPNDEGKTYTNVRLTKLKAVSGSRPSPKAKKDEEMLEVDDDDETDDDALDW